ncbi:MAG: hypothetical protein OSB34_06335 [Planktomarina sp.]|nr:hypothetical protein [Planktomarina sp.]
MSQELWPEVAVVMGVGPRYVTQILLGRLLNPTPSHEFPIICAATAPRSGSKCCYILILVPCWALKVSTLLLRVALVLVDTVHPGGALLRKLSGGHVEDPA